MDNYTEKDSRFKYFINERTKGAQGARNTGIPVISTFHAGIPDVILDGETGLLVAEHDVAAMAEKMILLLKNKELAMQLGKKGKERIKANFYMEKHLQIIDELIDNAIINKK